MEEAQKIWTEAKAKLQDAHKKLLAKQDDACAFKVRCADVVESLKMWSDAKPIRTPRSALKKAGALLGLTPKSVHWPDQQPSQPELEPEGGNRSIVQRLFSPIVGMFRRNSVGSSEHPSQGGVRQNNTPLREEIAFSWGLTSQAFENGPLSKAGINCGIKGLVL